MKKEDSIKGIFSEIGTNTCVVAVSKTKPDEDILAVYNQGQRIFGENKVQELEGKYERLPKDIKWHFIGHLQTNKVKYIAPFVSLIHSVDSLKILRVINKEAVKNNRVIDCLLQIKIAEEETKFGLSKSEVKHILSSPDFSELKNIQIKGIMGMATNTDDKIQVKSEFSELKRTFIEIRDSFFQDKDYFSEISMGMSHDYKIAVEEGATLVRIGSKIFGERVYH